MLAAFGFPLRVGAIRLGSLDLYRDRPGDLDLTQTEDAIAMSGIVTRAVLAMRGYADPGQLADEIGDAGALRTHVHQASGMVSEQLEITIGDALIRLRAHAYAESRPIDQVARDVVARRVRLE